MGTNERKLWNAIDAERGYLATLNEIREFRAKNWAEIDSAIKWTCPYDWQKSIDLLLELIISLKMDMLKLVSHLDEVSLTPIPKEDEVEETNNPVT